MEPKHPIVLLVLGVVLISGCTQKQEVVVREIQCADGSVVNDISLCPKATTMSSTSTISSTTTIVYPISTKMILETLDYTTGSWHYFEGYFIRASRIGYRVEPDGTSYTKAAILVDEYFDGPEQTGQWLSKSNNFPGGYKFDVKGMTIELIEIYSNETPEREPNSEGLLENSTAIIKVTINKHITTTTLPENLFVNCPVGIDYSVKKISDCPEVIRH